MTLSFLPQLILIIIYLFILFLLLGFLAMCVINCGHCEFHETLAIRMREIKLALQILFTTDLSFTG